MRNLLFLLLATILIFIILFSYVTITESRWRGLVWDQPQVTQANSNNADSPKKAAAEQTIPIHSTIDIMGRVISQSGQPVEGASVTYINQKTTTDEFGEFEFYYEEGVQWLTVEHPRFIHRTRAVKKGDEVLIRLTPDDGETISLHFVGDTMFGRRYFDPNEDGNPNDGLLGIDATPLEHLELLRFVQPLLESADISVINLESSLSPQPFIDPIAPRPKHFHPTKEYIFATHQNAAKALKLAGVDVIDLANNHLYDALEQGVKDTFNGLEDAGYQSGTGYFGAGLSESQAWKPAVINVKGQSIAFLGCTSITYPFIDGTPDKSAISYFASEASNKGGAARCIDGDIRKAVLEAAKKYDLVVMMIHGGSEYERAPTDVVIRMTNAAREAGANLVVNHQPHVVGGFEWDGSSVVAWTLGNFAFDQTLWETLETYLLAVHIRKGEVIRTYVEPLIIEGFIPKGVTGELAEFVARGAAGREPGPYIIEDGSMEIDLFGKSKRTEKVIPVEGKSEAGTIFKINSSWSVSSTKIQDEFKVGRDLLWVGSFENEDTDPMIYKDTLWELDGPNKYLGNQYAYSGNNGVRLQRGALDKNDVVLTTVYRIPVDAGNELSVVGMVRSGENALSEIQISWYTESRGPSSFQTVEQIEIGDTNTWQPFRYDTTVPDNIIALKLFLRLNPPRKGLVTADFDNLKIIRWAPEGTAYSPLYNYIKVTGDGKIKLSRDFLPSGLIDNAGQLLTPLE